MPLCQQYEHNGSTGIVNVPFQHPAVSCYCQRCPNTSSHCLVAAMLAAGRCTCIVMLSGWGRRTLLGGGGAEWGGGISGHLPHQILLSVLGHVAWYGGPLTCTGKIAGTDARSPIGGPVPILGGGGRRGWMSPNPQGSSGACLVPIRCSGRQLATAAPTGSQVA